MSLMTFVLFAAGLTLLVLGAELLVRGAARIASSLGISPLIIGLTIVAFGTSAPEMAVSVSSAWQGSSDLAVGNVVGSNIFNVLFILGASALITPLLVQQQLIRLDVPLMIAASLLLLLLGQDGSLGRLDGIILFSGIVAYTGFLAWTARRQSAAEQAALLDGVELESPEHPHWFKNSGFILGGLILLVLGSHWLVDSSVSFARALGVSELVIGLTIVAAGTSLPEVATSIMAAIKGERDIAVGNVVGSNLFNILSVLGISSLVAPEPIAVSDTAIRFDIPVMIAVAVACLPIFFTGRIITRANGATFLGYYIAYTAFLVLSAKASPSLATLTQVMTWFVIPLTIGVLLVSVMREFRSGRTT